MVLHPGPGPGASTVTPRLGYEIYPNFLIHRPDALIISGLNHPGPGATTRTLRLGSAGYEIYLNFFIHHTDPLILVNPQPADENISRTSSLNMSDDTSSGRAEPDESAHEGGQNHPV